MSIRNPIRKTALAIAIASTSTVALAQDVGLFETHVTPDTLLFEPTGDQSITSNVDLIIKGPEGFYLRKGFKAGELVEINPVELADGNLADGNYKFETRITGLASGPRVRGQDADLNVAPKISVTSGTFSIRNGRLIVPDVEAGGAKFAERVQSGATAPQEEKGETRDQVILDDLIVDGSACIGQDCVNGESFGFDTIRLKENNLRIKFEDTSSTASFPGNDWQLTANDSANGGQNKFSIDDIDGGRTPFTLEAGAPSHSLYVDDGGRVGFGTSTPVVENHIVNGDSPTVRLEQDGSSGFTPQIWDLAGNEANFFVRDVTNGSQLPFRIQPGADSNSLFIANNNNIGMGTASPSQELDIERNGPVGIDMTNTNAGKVWRFRAGNGGNFVLAEATTPGTDELVLDEDGNLTIRGEITTSSGTSPFPDYVFLDSYKLLPMEELSVFIEENGRLPGFPSATEVAEKGKINLTEMNKLLLEKIEELTLYTLQQQEAIAELRSKLESN